MVEKKVKKPVKRATSVAKKKPAAKVSNVRVETKKISTASNCSTACCCGISLKKILFALWILLITGLLLAILIGQSREEVTKAGGRENYKLLKQIYKTDGYKEQQKQQLEQALQIFSNPEQFMPSLDDMEYLDYEDMDEYYLE